MVYRWYTTQEEGKGNFEAYKTGDLEFSCVFNGELLFPISGRLPKRESRSHHPTFRPIFRKFTAPLPKKTSTYTLAYEEYCPCSQTLQLYVKNWLN